MGSLPSSFVFPFVSGKVIEGTGDSSLVSAMHFHGTRTIQNYRPLKDQRQRGGKKNLAPRLSHLLDMLDYLKKKNQTKKKNQHRFLCMRVLGKVLYLCTR